MRRLSDRGSSLWRALDSRLTVLLAHLLKWQYQPERQGKSWRLTIEEQRYQIDRLLRKNPSLKPALEETLSETYPSAVRSAAKETDLEVDEFPAKCPWLIEQVLDSEFYPK